MNNILIRFDDIAENMNWQLMDKCEKLFDWFKIGQVEFDKKFVKVSNLEEQLEK